MESRLVSSIYKIPGIIQLLTKSVAVFITLIMVYYMLGNFDAKTISLVVLSFAVIVFSAAFIIALAKDRTQKKRTLKQTVFES